MTKAKRRFQLVPQEYVRRSYERAEKIVEWYKRNPNSGSRSRSGPWGADRDPVRQSFGKIGECAVALFLELSPLTEIYWGTEKDGDGDFDLILPDDGRRIDIKTNLTDRSEFYPSKAVNDLYKNKKFDLLVSVSIEPMKFYNCWIEGWITKEEFFDRKNIVPESGYRGLTPWTWYMNKRDLYCIDQLHVRRGPVVNYCDLCGAYAHLGFNVNIRAGKTGQWFCFEHKPENEIRSTHERGNLL
jgi:hypothetical protein